MSGAVAITILGLTVRIVSAVDGALLRLAYINFERTLMECFCQGSQGILATKSKQGGLGVLATKFLLFGFHVMLRVSLWSVSENSYCYDFQHH